MAAAGVVAGGAPSAVGALLCVVRGVSAGRHWDPSSARTQLARTAALVVIQRQLGHAHLGVTSIYLQGIDSSEIIDTVHARLAPVISAAAFGAALAE